MFHTFFECNVNDTYVLRMIHVARTKSAEFSRRSVDDLNAVVSASTVIDVDVSDDVIDVDLVDVVLDNGVLTTAPIEYWRL